MFVNDNKHSRIVVIEIVVRIRTILLLPLPTTLVVVDDDLMLLLLVLVPPSNLIS